jgi:hypothetical protein
LYLRFKVICKKLNINTLLTMFVFIVLASLLSGQNPFDIESRLNEGQIADESTSSDSADTTTVLSNGKNEIDKNTVEKNFEKLKAENPFEVSHIPLVRKKGSSIRAIDLKIKPKVSNTFIFWIMLFSWALLALVLGNRRDILPKLLQSIFNENMLKLTKKQDGDRLNLHFSVIYLVFFINASVFIYLFIKNSADLAGTKYWFFVLCIIILIYVVRHMMLYITGWIFRIEKITSLYSFLIMVLNLLTGLVLIPVNLGMAFGPEFVFHPVMITGLVFISLSMLMRYFRGFFISANYIFNNIFLFFIYLCAFEIAPILIGIRMLRQYL